MKVLFLDIDGVLNSAEWFKKQRINKLIITETFTDVDPGAIELVNEIVELTMCKVVISSSWRLLFTRLDLQHILQSKGAKFDILDFTGNNPKGNRGSEISDWLNKNKCDKFVILDDDRDMEPLTDHLVGTNFETGLCRYQVEKCIEILSS